MRLVAPTLVSLPVAGVVGFVLGKLDIAFVWRAAALLGFGVVLVFVVIVVTMLWFDPEHPLRRYATRV